MRIEHPKPASKKFGGLCLPSVHVDDVARGERRQQKRLDIGSEAEPIERAVEHAGAAMRSTRSAAARRPHHLPPEITKNNREHTFPIAPMAQEIINRQTRRNDTPYLFPARKTWRKQSTVYNAWNKDTPKLRTASLTSGWVPHDCRRTFRTKWAELTIRREVAEKYINHISGTQSGVEGVYDRHSYLPEMREAVLKWEAHLNRLFNTAAA